MLIAELAGQVQAAQRRCLGRRVKEASGVGQAKRRLKG